MKVELKPCPFCGEDDKVYFTHSTIDGDRYSSAPVVGCSACGFYKEGCLCCSSSKEDTELSDIILINWWNKRAGEKK